MAEDRVDNAATQPSSESKIDLRILSPGHNVPETVDIRGVPINATVSSLKERITLVSPSHPPPESQRLIYQGHVLAVPTATLESILGAEAVRLSFYPCCAALTLTASQQPPIHPPSCCQVVWTRGVPSSLPTDFYHTCPTTVWSTASTWTSWCHSAPTQPTEPSSLSSSSNDATRFPWIPNATRISDGTDTRNASGVPDATDTGHASRIPVATDARHATHGRISTATGGSIWA